MQRRTLLGFLPFLLVSPICIASPDVWRRLQHGGLVIMMRHTATVPGIGDPPGFAINDCTTQRNLSAGGIAEAERIGAVFQRYRVPLDEVLSSRWCRCVDTARLAFKRVQPVSMLDSMFTDAPAARADKLRALRAFLMEWRGPGNLVLVTHDVNLRALGSEYLEQGEMVVAEPQLDGTLRLLGRLLPG